MPIESLIKALFSANKGTLEKVSDILSGKEDKRQKPTEAETRLITQKEAAKRLNLSTTSVWRLIKEGQLEVVKVRGRQRIRLSSLINYSLGGVTP